MNERIEAEVERLERYCQEVRKACEHHKIGEVLDCWDLVEAFTIRCLALGDGTALLEVVDINHSDFRDSILIAHWEYPVYFTSESEAREALNLLRQYYLENLNRRDPKKMVEATSDLEQTILNHFRADDDPYVQNVAWESVFVDVNDDDNECDT